MSIRDGFIGFFLITVFCVLWIFPITVQANDRSPYALPFPSSLSFVRCSQGNYDPQKSAPEDSHARYKINHFAFDFALSDGQPVAASRDGKILFLKEDSDTSCDNTSCYKSANYAVIDHGDGTSSLYYHLKQNSIATNSKGVKLREGDEVRQGVQIAEADTTGFCQGAHLHFQVQKTPTNRISPMTEAIKIYFADDSVCKESDCIPKQGKSYKAGISPELPSFSEELPEKPKESLWQKISNFFSRIFQFPNSATITDGLPADQKTNIEEAKKIEQPVVALEIKEGQNDLPKEILKKEEIQNIKNNSKASKSDSENKSKEGQTQTSVIPSTFATLPSGKIAYVSSRDGNQEIYSINSQTGKEINLTNNPSNDWDPAYSSDGAKIAFVSNRSGTNKIYAMAADGSNVKEIADGEYPGWFPNGSRIIFSQLIESSDKDAWGNPGVKYFRLYTINADGTQKQKLAIDPSISQKDESFEKYHCIEPMVSPDGAKIAFSAGYWVGGQSHSLYVVNEKGDLLDKYDGPGAYKIGPRDLFSPAWSSDGKVIFNAHYNALPSVEFGGGGLYSNLGSWTTEEHKIWEKVISSSEVEEIADGDYPAPLPNGNYMAYAKSDNNIYILDLDNGTSQKLTASNNNWSPAWAK